MIAASLSTARRPAPALGTVGRSPPYPLVQESTCAAVDQRLAVVEHQRRDAAERIVPPHFLAIAEAPRGSRCS